MGSKTGFKKWEKFENHYNEVFVERFDRKNPGRIESAKFQITEKIDGANFAILFEPQSPVRYFKRSGPAGGNFFNYLRLFEEQEYIDFVQNVQDFVDYKKINLQFTGELFGKGIQRRINYGDGKYWRWFGIYEKIDGTGPNLITLDKEKQYRENILKELNYDIFLLRCPTISDSISYEDFKRLDVEELKSLICEDIVEGVCCRNWGEIITYGESKLFLKKKGKKFVENSGKSRKPPKPMAEEIKQIIEDITPYINKNRTLSLFSKEGELTDIRDFGKYMSLYSKDVFEDYDRDTNYMLDDIPKSDIKSIRRVISSFIKDELMKVLKNGN